MAEASFVNVLIGTCGVMKKAKILVWIGARTPSQVAECRDHFNEGAFCSPGEIPNKQNNGPLSGTTTLIVER